MIRDIAAQNASLANDYGPTRGPNAADNLAVALFNGHPNYGGIELDSTGGYARVVRANDATMWPTAPADGAIQPSATSFGTSTGAWSDTVTHWALIDDDTGVMWDCGPLLSERSVGAAGVTVVLGASEISIFYSTLN